MPTVFYRNQPGIAKSLGHVPLAGDAHVYTVKKLLWPEEVTTFLQAELIATSINVCCGKSRLCDYQLDLHENAGIKADATRLPLKDNSIDTVLCDPPYNGKFQWNHDMLSELCRVASRRIIFQHWFVPANKHGYYKKNHSFRLSGLYAWQPKTYFGRVQMISIFDYCEPEQPSLFV